MSEGVVAICLAVSLRALQQSLLSLRHGLRSVVARAVVVDGEPSSETAATSTAADDGGEGDSAGGGGGEGVDVVSSEEVLSTFES